MLDAKNVMKLLIFGPTITIADRVLKNPSKLKTPRPEFRGPLSNFTSSFIKNVLMDQVEPIPGSIVYCDLGFGIAEHSGIYIGRNRIVHLDGSGKIEKVSPAQFLNRLDGMNSAISIYVSCRDGAAIGSKSAASYARNMVGKRIKYNVLNNNCHRFTSECISGSSSDYLCEFYLLKAQIEKDMKCNEWRVWRLN
ncbi:lecithin retinol acyltransferase family protein [Pseudomonas alabamensis]|uniref:lecithin retinol acyltransferase family protein n=1 Tax=Pseudomonas alabamensis TaxID=3064349 RepID=UPI0021D8B67B|nr:lecithin retinol acyltransferase family protein [Pseudomonas entomophila]